MTGRRRLAGLAVGASVVLAGCGGSSGQTVTPAAAQRLQQQVQQVRLAVYADNRSRTAAALDRLRTLVEQERSSGGVSDSRAQAILDAADTLQSDLDNATSPSASPSPTTATSSPPPPPPPTQSASPTPSPSTSSPPPPPPSPSPSLSVTVPPPTIGVGPTSSDSGASTPSPGHAAAGGG